MGDPTQEEDGKEIWRPRNKTRKATKTSNSWQTHQKAEEKTETEYHSGRASGQAVPTSGKYENSWCGSTRANLYILVVVGLCGRAGCATSLLGGSAIAPLLSLCLPIEKKVGR